MDYKFDLKGIETLFLQSEIDYQLLYDQKWWKCDVESTVIEKSGSGSGLQLQINGKDEWGKWIFEGQIMITPENTITLSAKKTYQVYSIDDYSIFYEGNYDAKQSGFFGHWYYDETKDNINSKFYIKFVLED